MTGAPTSFLQLWFLPATARRAILVGLVVGTILCLINQWQAIVLGVGSIDWLKAVLTYFVPYAVSSYSTAASLRAQNSAQKSGRNGQ